jgi:phospholipid transport system substrate-binding protein
MATYMTFMMKALSKMQDRRSVLFGLAAIGAASVFPMRAFAFSPAQAEAQITKVVADITSIINSGKPVSSMIGSFERLFATYADVPRVAQLVLGADNRRATPAERTAFAKSFQGYMARKYGKRFREFIGGKITVNKTRTVKTYYEVVTTAQTAQWAPYEVIFVVANTNGRFIDIVIEGISLIKAERTEIGAMLDRRGGNISQMIEDLQKAG